MKSLASVTLSLLLLASVSFSSAYAQDNVPPVEDAPVAAATEDDAGFPALDESSDDDLSIDDIIAGASEDKPEDEVAPTAEAAPKENAGETPVETAPVDAAESSDIPLFETEPVEESAAVEEPAVETLESEEQAKQAEEEAAAVDLPVEAEATDEDPVLFDGIEGMEFSEQMPAETKELEFPGDSAAANAPKGSDCIVSAGTPADVTVPDVCNYVDIHARRLAYKASAEKLTASLESRRVSFERPHFEALEKYRADLEKVYAEDSKKYQTGVSNKKAQEPSAPAVKKLDDSKLEEQVDVPEGLEDAEVKSPEAAKVEPEKEPEPKTEVKVNPPVEAEKEAKPDEAAPQEPVGLKEEELAPEVDEEGQPTTNKKVVMPEDAPDFDPGLIE